MGKPPINPKTKGGIDLEKDNREQKEIPVKEADVLDVDIISTGKDGDGIAKFQGFVIIVPKALEGQNHEIRITKVMPRLAFAEIIN